MLFFRNTNCVHCLSYCSFVESLETGKYESLNFVLYQDCFDSSGPFISILIFESAYQFWQKKTTKILMGIQLNL